MRTERNILIAFILNLAFSVFEFVGGAVTGSVAIVSDAMHDTGDAVSIGISYFLERKSKKKPDEKFTYGYVRYSVVGSMITSVVLMAGSVIVIYNAVIRIINPVEIQYDKMIVFAIVGVLVNFCAAYFTRQGHSLNQRAVNLHMLEDVLGWAVVLVGAVVMRFTDIKVIDPVLSIATSVLIFVGAVKNVKSVTDLFLEKTPAGVDVCHVKEHLLMIDGVLDVHHIHIRSLDGHNNYATMHIVTDLESHKVKQLVREELKEHGIVHVTLELETPDEVCSQKCCNTEFENVTTHHHHRHH